MLIYLYLVFEMQHDPQAQINSKSGNVVCDNIRIREDIILTGVIRGKDELATLVFANDVVMQETLVVEGVLTAQNGVVTDTISEYTAAAGVTADGVLLKDSSVTGLNLTAQTAVVTNVISERTGAAGVTADGVLLKDSSVTGLILTANTNVVTDIIAEKTAAAGVTADGVLLKDSSVTGLILTANTNVVTDIIAEKTAAAGVTADGVLLKDSHVTCVDLTTSGNTILGDAAADALTVNAKLAASGIKGLTDTSFVGIVFDALSEVIPAATGGAISVVTYYSDIAADAGGDAFTLAAGTMVGQLKNIRLSATAGGTAVITSADLDDALTTITMAAANQEVTLMWNANSKWRVIRNLGAVLA